jgi:hypothetical protein
MTKYSSIAALLLVSVLAACGDKEVQSLVSTTPQARVRFFNFGVNAPSVNFYADATKMTAVQSTSGTESTSGVAYGGVGANGAYSAIDPGQHALAGRSRRQPTRIWQSTVTTTVEDAKVTRST